MISTASSKAVLAVGNITAGAALKRRQYRLDRVHITQYYNRSNFQKIFNIYDGLTVNPLCNTLVRVVQNEIMPARAAQTVIASGKRSDVKEAATLPQRLGNTFPGKRMFIYHRDRDLHIPFG